MCYRLDVERTLSALSADGSLTVADVDYCREPSSRSFMTMRLLRLLDERGSEGDQVLQKVLYATKQQDLASELWSLAPSMSFDQSLVGSQSYQSLPSLAAANFQQANVLGPPSTNWNLADRHRETTVAQAGADKSSNNSEARLALVPNPSTSIISAPTTEEGSIVPLMHEKPRNEPPRPPVDELNIGLQSGTSSPRHVHGYQSPLRSLSGVIPGAQRSQTERRLISPDGAPETHQRLVEEEVQGHDLVLSAIPTNVPEWVPQSASPSQSPGEDKGEPQVISIVLVC